MEECKKRINKKTVLPAWKGSPYIFLLLYKAIAYTGKAKSNGAMERDVYRVSSDSNVIFFENCNHLISVASPSKYRSNTVTA